MDAPAGPRAPRSAATARPRLRHSERRRPTRHGAVVARGQRVARAAGPAHARHAAAASHFDGRRFLSSSHSIGPPDAHRRIGKPRDAARRRRNSDEVVGRLLPHLTKEAPSASGRPRGLFREKLSHFCCLLQRPAAGVSQQCLGVEEVNADAPGVSSSDRVGCPASPVRALYLHQLTGRRLSNPLLPLLRLFRIRKTQCALSGSKSPSSPAPPCQAYLEF